MPLEMLMVGAYVNESDETCSDHAVGDINTATLQFGNYTVQDQAFGTS